MKEWMLTAAAAIPGFLIFAAVVAEVLWPHGKRREKRLSDEAIQNVTGRRSSEL